MFLVGGVHIYVVKLNKNGGFQGWGGKYKNKGFRNI